MKKSNNSLARLSLFFSFLYAWCFVSHNSNSSLGSVITQEGIVVPVVSMTMMSILEVVLVEVIVFAPTFYSFAETRSILDDPNCHIG